ncbi:hypothetical protein SNE510_60750 [Streptomyces sp. NE5-10]|uniref:hypothetical protein n=1 Tax=Streptomyces sp. NE5-10 TaxID=2759674 RepID=UPI001905425E|nr:hypothetical protein [Streptomyces sp. NE5-10]GHJ96556.1 hypothetical protein SNE510_60750 [Streptomyces sp. NE5-10]
MFGKKRGRGKKAGPPVHDDLVRRDFTAAGPNRLWLADITEHATGDGTLYLCALKDVFSSRRMHPAQRSRLAVPAPGVRPGARPAPDGRIDREGRGSRGQRGHGVLLQPLAEERPRPPQLVPRQELRIAIVTWIERTYHRRRRQAALGRLTAVAYETVMTTPALQAA